MHYLIKHIGKNIGISLFLIFSILICTNANSEQSAESIIKERKALFSKNYKTAKKVQSLSASGDFDKAKELMIEMSKNYEVLLGLFPENSKEGFKTGSLPIIWEEKDSFNALMQKSSDDMVKLTSVIETTDDVRGTIGKLMWGNCKACHSKYREEH
ncbi:cytochrome c [Candidatus Pelagibacter sp.]|nr:cytochrome c [Candidatus Pelagibacter sp.]MDA9631091.1 cytochrome c [Candidatus Pelagibacter sp.]